MAVGLNATTTTAVTQTTISSSAYNTNIANLNGAANPQFSSLDVSGSATVGGGSGKNLILAQGGGIAGSNILPDNLAGTPSAYALYGWDGSVYNRALSINTDGSITGNVGTSYSGFSRFTGAATGTYSHGLGIAPSGAAQWKVRLAVS